MQRTIFNDIVEGKVPCYKVYENHQFMAFLDIFPRTKGHTLVIPKTQYRWVYDVPNFAEYWETTHKITKAIQKALQPTWVSYLTFGLDVAYAHIHILPYHSPEDKKIPVFGEVIPITKDELQRTADKIKLALVSL